MFASLGKAFEKMTNEQGMYEITLYPATKVLSEKGVYVYCSGAVLPLTLPKVKELYIKGTNTIIDTARYYKSVLFADGIVTANSNLILEQIDFYAKDLKMGQYKLTSKEGVKFYLG